MWTKINKFFCKELGHDWDYGPDIKPKRICKRCGREENATIVNENKKMDVIWQA